MNSVLWFQRRSRKFLSQSKARMAIFFPIGLKNTNLEKDIEILLPVKFRWIPFSSFRREVENVSATQTPELSSCFSDRPEKHKLIISRGCWDLASSQVSLNSVLQFQVRGRKCLSQSEAKAVISFFQSARKNTNMVKDVDILLPVKFCLIPFYGFRGEVKNVSAIQRPGRQSFFRSVWKNTKLVKDIEILLPVRFRWIPFSGFRGEVENVSANQTSGWPSCFSDRPDKTQSW